MEGFGQHFDELSEVHSFVCNIVEDGLVAVTLVFHIADFHVQAQSFGNLTALDHGVVFPAFGLSVFVPIRWPCDAVDAFDVISRLQVGLFQLQLDQSSGQCHHSDIVSGIGFHCHYVSFFQFQVIHIVKISLAGVLELHLYEVG